MIKDKYNKINEEKKSIQNLIEEKKISDINYKNELNINDKYKNNLSKNINLNKNIYYKKDYNTININKNKNIDNFIIKNDKLSQSNIQEDNNVEINDISKKNINNNNKILKFNGIINNRNNLKNETIKIISISKDKNTNTINKIEENQKKMNNNFSTINDSINNNIIESKKNSKIYSPPKSPKKVLTYIHSTINNNLPNLNVYSNYLNKKQQTIRPSSSANYLYKGRNLKSQRILIDTPVKSPISLSKTINQNQLFEEEKKNKNIDCNINNQNDQQYFNNEIYFFPNYTQFKSNKIKTNLNPNVQALQHGVQQIYDNVFFDKQNQINHSNKKLLNSENIKRSSSLNNTDLNYKQRKFYGRNIEAKEIQGMIYNLKSYINGYDSNFINQSELKEEKKKISKNSSYYKFKEIINEYRKDNNDIKIHKIKKNIVEIGLDNYK